jgi:N-acetylneuraminic acid mutarotase
MKWLFGLLLLNFGFLLNSSAVPPVLNYAGQVTVNGEAFDGAGLFKFALVNADGTTTYWSNDGTSVDGSEPQVSVSVAVNGGLYAVLLGNTAQQGMGAIDPALFAQHTDAKLRVWFSDGVNGFQQLSPDRPFASVPYAFNSESAKSADTANVATTAMAVQAGAVTSSMLASNAVTSDKLSPQIKADINATIGMNRLSTEVTEKLNQEKTTTNYNAPSVGSLLAVPSGSDAPAGYSLYQRGEPKLVWEEKAPVSVARCAYDGVEVLDGKIYFAGGRIWNSNNNFKLIERYDLSEDHWETLTPMSLDRGGMAASVLNGKLYALGGMDLKSVEIFDPVSGEWEAGIDLPYVISHTNAVTANNKIYLVGGRGASGQRLNQTLCFDPSSNQWSSKANMPTARSRAKLVWFENRIWVIGGNDGGTSKKVESYDPFSSSWQMETSLNLPRESLVAWIANEKIYVGGGNNGSSYFRSIEVYDPTTKQWSDAGNFPENKQSADAVVLNDQVYVIAGQTAPNVYSNKVFAADLNASVEGVYDLYRKDGDAPVGTPVVQSEYADGSVTASKMAEGAVSKSALDATILKYLKPEITSQPQAKTVYAKTNASYSVTAEGKYLTYQWKKDGVDLIGETNATLNISDANATLHDGNYSVVVSNDFGSVESNKVEVQISDVLLNGLVGWWKFDEGSGTVAYDSSENGNEVNLTNGPTWISGKIGGALSFDGVDDFGSVDVNKSFNPTAFSVCCWVFIENANDGMILNKGMDNALNFRFYIDTSNNYVFDTFNPRLLQNSIGKVDTLQWVHFTLIVDNLNQNFYKNGLLGQQGTRSSIVFKDSTLLQLGSKLSLSSSSFCKFQIDDLRIYDRALSAEEVQALYNLGQ